MATRIIGLHGPAQSGKDTAAARLARYGFDPLAFAGPLKEAALALNPYILLDTGVTIRLAPFVSDVGWHEAKFHEDVRRLLQRLGTEVGRERMSPDPTKSVWIALAEVEALKRERVVFTDVRFPDEAEFIRSLDGVVIRIDGRGGLSGTNAAHASEQRLPRELVDAAIHNNGTLEHLYDQVDRLAHLFLDYGRPATEDPEEVVDLSSLVAEAE